MILDGRVSDVVAAVFSVDASKMKDSDSPATIAAWDSVGHLQLMLAIEAEFGVTFTPDTMAQLTSVGAIRRHLATAVSE